MNTHIQSLKVWLKSVLSRLKYSIFSRGLFFIGAPCIYIKYTSKCYDPAAAGTSRRVGLVCTSAAVPVQYVNVSTYLIDMYLLLPGSDKADFSLAW